MPVPKAAVNKDHRTELRKNEIRFAWQSFVVKNVSKSLGM